MLVKLGAMIELEVYAAGVRDLAFRLTGSSDLYQWDGRDPFASINFITAPDGFTLRDLVSYNEQHNDANQEDNRDGTADHRPATVGVEAETEDPPPGTLRQRQQRPRPPPLLAPRRNPARRRPPRPTTRPPRTTPASATPR